MNTKESSLLKAAKQTLISYIEKGYEAGIIPGAPHTPDGMMGKEPDTYEWFLWEVIKLDMYTIDRQFVEISKLLQYMKKKNMLVGTKPDKDFSKVS